MPDLLEPDLCVIGSGPGAFAAATGVAALGARTVLVPHGPSSQALKLRALVTAAAAAHAARHAGKFGVTTGEIGVDFGKVKDHVREVAASLAPNETPERLVALGIRVIDGAPRFTGPGSLAVDERFEI